MRTVTELSTKSAVQGTPGCIIKESEISDAHTQHTEGLCNCVSNRETSPLPFYSSFFIMATRSRIGIQLKDDSIVSVYHHWDGYPGLVG